MKSWLPSMTNSVDTDRIAHGNIFFGVNRLRRPRKNRGSKLAPIFAREYYVNFPGSPLILTQF